MINWIRLTIYICILGTIREYCASDGPPGPESEYAVPDDAGHPHNWPALPAVETVWSYVKKFESLEWIAWRADTELGIIESHDDEVRKPSHAWRMGSITVLPAMR